MVGDVVWSGGPPTAPRPNTVRSVAAAFGTTTDTHQYDLNMCPVSSLPGVPMLSFWANATRAYDNPPYPDGIVAVFPSAQTLAAGFPNVVAQGEVDSPPETVGVCQGPGGPSGSLKMHWMARGNVLVGVLYDPAKGVEKDPVVAEARADLQKLSS